MDVRHAIREFDLREMLRRPETRLGAAVLAILACIWVFVEIADTVGDKESSGFDETIMFAMREGPNNIDIIGPGWVAKFAQDLTALGGFPVILLLSLIVVGYLLLSRHFIRALEVVLAIGGGTILVMVLKELYARPRPEVVPPMYEVATFSFPSGHSSTAAVVYLTLGLLLARFVQRRTLTLYIIGTAFFLTLVVGWTRIALGVHYPTDVLAGWTMGLSWALFSWLAVHLWENRKSRRDHERRDAEMYEDTEAEETHIPRGSVLSSDPQEQM